MNAETLLRYYRHYLSHLPPQRARHAGWALAQLTDLLRGPVERQVSSDTERKPR